MPVKKLKDFLDSHKIKYTTISHSQAYTAQEIAATAHISGQAMAKTVMIKVDGKMAMAVLPASFRVDFNLLKEAIDAKNVVLAGEKEFQDLFPECDIGAMPPFGNLYDMQVYVAQRLTEDKEIAFNAGSHTELIKLTYKDFAALVKPRIMKFSAP
jgi:Ala-tRNA(Pro) deacylase